MNVPLITTFFTSPVTGAAKTRGRDLPEAFGGQVPRAFVVTRTGAGEGAVEASLYSRGSRPSSAHRVSKSGTKRWRK